MPGSPTDDVPGPSSTGVPPAVAPAVPPGVLPDDTAAGSPPAVGPLAADLVLEGGGVRGIALAGAVGVLAEAGYAFPRVGGSSAGAVVGCLVAALTAAGEPVQRLAELVATADYRTFRDRRGVARLPVVGLPLAVLLHEGAYAGVALERFLQAALEELGVRTFGDLRAPAAAGLPEGRDWRLVVTVSDLSRRRLVRLPWDLPDYGLDPDAFPVARAVRASAAIPYVFRPVRVRTRLGTATWVDGGLLSNFPLGLFDRADALAPRWPTFGVRLSMPPDVPPVLHPVRGPVALGVAALDALLTDQDQAYAAEPCSVARTVVVPDSGVSVIDFDLSAEQAAALTRSGRAAAQAFLAHWDLDAYVAGCRAAPAGPVPPVPVAAPVRAPGD